MSKRRREPILRIGLGNLGPGNKAHKAHLIESFRCASFGINEGRGAVQHFKDRRYRLHRARRGQNGARMTRGFLDTPILVKKYLKPTLFHHERISNRVLHALRVAPDRHVHVAGFQHRIGEVIHVNIHLNAGWKTLTGHNPRKALVREYARSVRKLDRLLTRLRRDHPEAHIIVTGDVNMPEHIVRPWSVHPVLRKHGLVVHTRGIDLIAVDDRLELTKPLRVIPQHVTRADHPWLIARLRRRHGR